jgi:hypothetical protein
MKKPQITFAFVLAHAWVLMIFFGALVFDTLIVYPNTFHDVPRSLERDGVRCGQGSWRLLPTPRFGQLDHRHRVPATCLACEACPVLDPRQPDRDGLRRTVLDGLLLAPEHDHVHGGHSGPFRCFPEADGPGVRGGTLDTVRAGRGSSGDLVHGATEVLAP